VRPADIFVVIPSWNEGEVLGHTVAELLPYGYSIVVVDDGSAIPARQFLHGLTGHGYPIHCLRHSANLGQGAALRTGTEYAQREGARIVVHFDADGQHSPAQIERLVRPVSEQGFDVALGSRFLDDADRRQVPLEKRILLRAGILVSWVFTGVWLSDTHNGFRALSRRAAGLIRMEESGFAHATEILELMRKSGLRYTEVPVTVRYTQYSRAKGQSVFGSIDILIDLVIAKLSR
jgi:glycosyltransferase involved in cell wall biosynthesis